LFSLGLSKWVRGRFQTYRDFQICLTSLNHFVAEQLNPTIDNKTEAMNALSIECTKNLGCSSINSKGENKTVGDTNNELVMNNLTSTLVHEEEKIQQHKKKTLGISRQSPRKTLPNVNEVSSFRCSPRKPHMGISPIKPCDISRFQFVIPKPDIKEQTICKTDDTDFERKCTRKTNTSIPSRFVYPGGATNSSTQKRPISNEVSFEDDMEFSLISTQVLRPDEKADTSHSNSTNSVILNVSRNFGKTNDNRVKNDHELTLNTTGMIKSDDGYKSKLSELISIPSPELFDVDDYEMSGDDDLLLSPVLANLKESSTAAKQSKTDTIQPECKNNKSNQSNQTDDSLMNVTSTTLQGVVRRRKRSTKVTRNLRRTSAKVFDQEDHKSKTLTNVNDKDFAALCKIDDHCDNSKMVNEFTIRIDDL